MRAPLHAARGISRAVLPIAIPTIRLPFVRAAALRATVGPRSRDDLGIYARGPRRGTAFVALSADGRHAASSRAAAHASAPSIRSSIVRVASLRGLARSNSPSHFSRRASIGTTSVRTINR